MSGFTADDINLGLHNHQHVGVTLRINSIRQEALLQPLGGALVCCVRNLKSLMHMVSGIIQEALIQPLGDALVCCVRNRKSLMHMVSGINPSDPNPYYLRECVRSCVRACVSVRLHAFARIIHIRNKKYIYEHPN